MASGGSGEGFTCWQISGNGKLWLWRLSVENACLVSELRDGLRGPKGIVTEAKSSCSMYIAHVAEVAKMDRGRGCVLVPRSGRVGR